MLTGEWTGRKTATDCCKVVRQYTTVRWLCDFFSKARKPRNIDIARGTIIVGINHSNRYWILIYIIEDGCPAVHTRLSSVVSAMSFPSPSKNLRNARAMQSFSHNFLRMKWQVGVIPVLGCPGYHLGCELPLGASLPSPHLGEPSYNCNEERDPLPSQTFCAPKVDDSKPVKLRIANNDFKVELTWTDHGNRGHAEAYKPILLIESLQ